MLRYIHVRSAAFRKLLFAVCGLFLLSFSMLLVSCGPKAVGDDVYVAPPSGATSAAQDPAQARYPLGGRSLDKALYFVNTPAFMQARQQRTERYLHENYVGKEAPNDYTNLQPRQISPFRQ